MDVVPQMPLIAERMHTEMHDLLVYYIWRITPIGIQRQVTRVGY